jgi:hypothetical protein
LSHLDLQAHLELNVMSGNTLLRWLKRVKRHPMWWMQALALTNRTAKHGFWPELEGMEPRVVPATITPAQLRAAYGIDQIRFGAAGIVGNGAGQTIGIPELGIDADLVSDLQYFDRQLFGSGPDGAGLLDTFGSYNGPVQGSTKPWFGYLQDPNFPPAPMGTSKQDLEADEDVEWAHAIAPMANILVVQTSSIQSGTAVAAAQTQLGVSVVASSSYHFPDNFHPTDYMQPNVAFVGITGDTGTAINSQQVEEDDEEGQFTADNYPATSPLVIAVGGTTLTLNADGSYGSETGWGFAGPNRFLTSSAAVYFSSPEQPWTSVAGGFSGTYFTTNDDLPPPPPNNTATWTTTVTASDTLGLNDSGLEVSATWTAAPGNAADAHYLVSVNGSLVDTVTVNQQLAPNGTTGTQNSRTATFQELVALTNLAVGDSISVELVSPIGQGTVVADAIGLGPDDASGGGLSNEPQPSYQAGLVIHNGNSIISSGGTRTDPDVAFDGDYINSPVEIYDQDPNQSPNQSPPWNPVRLVAGTSLGSPAWAGLLAIADQGLATAGHTTPLDTATALTGLYKLPSYDFHDETSGYNGYSAGPGYDLVTGLGSPIANQLILGLDNTVAPVSGPLIYEAPEGQGANNINVGVVGTNIDIWDNGTVVASAPVAETTAIDIIGANNTSNTLTLNFGPVTNLHPFPAPPTGIPVTFDGGSLNGGSGTLILQGGTFTAEIDTASGPHSGTLTLDNDTITYTNLAPIIDTTTAASLTINDPLAGDHITVQNDPNSPETGTPTSEIQGSGFEKLEIGNKTKVFFTDISGSGTDTFDLIDPLVNSATLTITHPVTHFQISGPTGATAGLAVMETVTALDANGNVVPTYAGTVHFTSTDAAASLPGAYTFQVGDGGNHTFAITMQTVGSQSVTATDASASIITATGLLYTAKAGPPSPQLPTVANALTHSYEAYYDFVLSAYQQYLGRAPSLNEVNGWITDMQRGLSDETLEASFIGSTEYIANHGGAGAAWVTGMYENLLGRVPSQAEVNQWVADINGGLSTTAIAYSFAAGTEREDNRVTADYLKYEDRAPSQAEVNQWVSDFLLGLSNEDVVAGFVGGPEFYDKNGGGPAAWLDAAYFAVLGRHADAAAFASWMPMLGM